MKPKMPSYGGQAVIEGVLMRGTAFVAMANRAPDGQISITTETLSGIYLSALAKIPFLRGLVLLWDALGLGMRFLTRSANIQTGEEEKIEGPTLYISLGVSLLIGVGIFFVAPAALGQLVERWLHWSALGSNLLEGAIRLAVFIAYLWGVGKMPEISRVFAYHGAEHKTINAYEAGVELVPEKVALSSLLHPRCGTSFLLTLVVLSVIVFAFFGPMPILLRLVTRIVFIPVLAGVAYEYIRWMAGHLTNPIVALLIQPNLALQKLTTREPDLGMLEVSIAAFKTLLEHEDKNRLTTP
ncbi:MAG TPA: DUF1385 domain-containing protein [Anaerolineaceae bacterium]